MNKSHMLELSLVAAAVAFGLAPTVHAQDEDQTQEVREAENELERAEDRLEQAEENVDEREDALQDAIAEAAATADEESEPSDAVEFDDADWDALIEDHPDLSTFVDALQFTRLDDTLASGTAYTVFAPIDDAFEEQGDDLLREDNREDLVDLLRAHIVADDVDPVRARSLDEALTVDGGTVELSVEDDALMVGDAEVLDSDIRLGNLRIYTIDDVLDADPDTDVALGDFDED